MIKAYIIKTGEIFDVVREYTKFKLNINLPDDISIEIREEIESKFAEYHNVDIKFTNSGSNSYYDLSDGNTYQLKELIVGIDEIREFKLRKIKNIS